MKLPTCPSPVAGAPVAMIGPPPLKTSQTSFAPVVMVGWSTNRNRPRRSLPVLALRFPELAMLAITANVKPPSVLRATGTRLGTVFPIRNRYVMNRLPYLSKDKLGSQQADPSGSPGAPVAIRRLVQVAPLSKVTPSNMPAAVPPILVTITTLLGSVGFTATASSDSLPRRWLTLTFTGFLAVAAWDGPAASPDPAASRTMARADTTAMDDDPLRIAPSLQSEPRVVALRLCGHADRGGRVNESVPQSAPTAGRPRPGLGTDRVWFDLGPIATRSATRRAVLYNRAAEMHFGIA